MAQRSGINRSLMWLRKVLQITEETDSPRVLSEIAQPSIDLFGWDRLAAGAQGENATGAATSDFVGLTAVPEGTMRYVILASMSHDDPVAGGLSMSFIMRVDGLDIGIGPPAIGLLAEPVRAGLGRPILMEPGSFLIARSTPAPAVAQAINIRYRFVDIDFGEYIAAM